MDVVLNSLAGGFGRSLEQWSHINIETTVGISCCYYLCTTVVTVLSHLGNEDTWATTFFLCKLFCELTSNIEVLVVLAF